MVTVKLYDEADDTLICTSVLAAVPAIGTEVMVLRREWERWSVVGLRYWPGNDEIAAAPSVWAYVRYGGDLD